MNRPHIAETFINQLMSTHLEDATSITFRIDHLTACVNQLASDIMSREKLVFEKYALHFAQFTSNDCNLLVVMY